VRFLIFLLTTTTALLSAQAAAKTIPWQMRQTPANLYSAVLGSNGYINVAWMTAYGDAPTSATESKNGDPKNGDLKNSISDLNAKALPLVQAAFKEYPNLDEVDISIYPLGTPPENFKETRPLMTLSVPRERSREVLALPLEQSWSKSYDRVYYQSEPLSAAVAPRVSKARDLLVAQHSPRAIKNSVFIKGIENKTPSSGLTFDDAPHPLYAPLLLDTLARLNLHATFFIIGRNAESYPYFVRDIVREGHEIANHTYDHRRFIELNEDQMFQEIENANQTLERITGERPLFFRPPGGNYSPKLLGMLSDLKMVLGGWTNSTGDFMNVGVPELLRRMNKGLVTGSIVLLHENVDDTLDALPKYAQEADARGIKLMPMRQLLFPQLDWLATY
jgi:peptidoglycan-N-acetylglucosamine deacetylase